MKQFIFFIISFSLLAACNTSKENATTQKNTPTLDDAISKKINEVGQRYLALERFSGVILVGQKNADQQNVIVFEEFYGLANVETKQAFQSNTAFKIGRLTTNVIRYIVNEMLYQKVIRLDEKVATYLPQLKGEYTVDNILKHNTGLPPIAELKKDYPEETYDPIHFANLANSNLTYRGPSDLPEELLCKIIEKQHGSLDKALEIYFGDLGLENTYFVKENALEATGHVIKSSKEGLIPHPTKGYSYEDVYSHQDMKSTARDVLKMASNAFKNINYSYGFVEGDASSFAFYKKGKHTIIVLSNRRHPVCDEIAKSIQAILEQQPYQLPLLRETVEIDKELLADYTGWYAVNENMKVEVIQENDSLFVMMGPNRVALIPQSGNQFYMIENDAAMRFLRDSTGKVHRVELLNGFMTSDQFATKLE